MRLPWQQFDRNIFKIRPLQITLEAHYFAVNITGHRPTSVVKAVANSYAIIVSVIVAYAR